MLEKAFEKKGELGLKTLKLKQANCHNLPFENETFDTIVDTFSLTSYYDHDKVLLEMKRVLKPDGKILMMERGLSYLSLYNSYLKFRAA